MPIVGIVKVSLDEVIDVVAMRHSFVATTWPVDVLLRMSRAFVPGRAVLRIGLGHGDDMLIKMIGVRTMQMAIVQITDVIIMDDANMAAFGPVWMSMIFVLWQVTIAHCHSLVSESGYPRRGSGKACGGCYAGRQMAADCFSCSPYIRTV